MRLFVSIKTMIKIALCIDKKSLLICITYNLIKQLMNVFYGVHFVRMILAGLETKRSFGHILAVLVFMFVINILFSRFNQYYKNIYLPIFKLKVDCYINEKIMRKANSIPYDIANSPRELDKYNRIIKNSSEMIMQAYQSFGLVCGLLEAFIMVLYYIINVDIFAIVLSSFPLLYSYFLAEKSAEFKYELDKKISSFSRKKEYAKRVFYLHNYTAEIRTSKIGRIVKEIYQEGFMQTEDAYLRNGKKIALIAFFELLLGDAIAMVLPLVYVVIRMLCGAQYLMGDFIGITQAITIFSSDVEWMLDTMLELKSASLYISDYIDYISQEGDQVREGKKLDKTNEFHIVFDHVQYQYPGNSEGVLALEDVSVDIRSGEKIAVVGENGAGKTTFVSLLVNLISCSNGRILLNGTDINAYGRRELKSFFGVVCQDYQIYPVSIRDNVSINGCIADADIKDAIIKVGLADRINDINLVAGKEINDKGLELSGGERQRLALARVVANKFPVVILDEPTSALDALTERNINQLILSALKDTNRTLIFISHKLSTTKLVDRILVFEHGRIVEQGNHVQLMKKEGLYSRMYNEQSNMYKGQNI
ncbi:MAG: ABC transporter ATP-binding protein [Lachnospiraceae bacterium]|nr:ABC transporter ATP-binding protein [Lachnospiraceae bacterium]